VRRAARAALAAAALAALALAGFLAGSLLAPAGGGQPTAGPAAAASRPAPPRPAPPPGASRAAPPRPAPPPGASLVATVRGRRSLAVVRRPGARRPLVRLPARTPAGGPRVLLVRARRGGWLRVLLPVRPNGAGGWIRARRVALRVDRYRVTVALRAHRLVVRRGARVVLRAPVGVGRAATPTPVGLAYVIELLRQPHPRGTYGPWAFGLSFHSRVLERFGGGDGEVGIHGTDDPAGIGHDVSHGCIRLRNAAVERLARILPLGTPVRIVRRGAAREFRNS